jgi:hypothetical protein
MTPAEVERLTDDEWKAFCDYMADEARAIERERRKARR